MGGDHMNGSPKPTRVVWGSVTGLLIVSTVIAFAFVRWIRNRGYRSVPEEDFTEVDGSLGHAEDDLNLVLNISPTNLASRLNKVLSGTSTSYNAAASSDSLLVNISNDPRCLSNAFDETSDSSNRRTLSKSRLNSLRSYPSTSTSSYSTRIISSGIWKTSFRTAFLSKPIYHTLQHPRITFPLAGGRLTGFRPTTAAAASQAEYVDPFSPFPYGQPDRHSRDTSTLTNPSLHIPHASSSFLDAYHSKEHLEPVLEDMPTPTESEEVVFYSAAKSQLLGNHVARRVLPLRPLPPLPSYPRPLPRPPQTGPDIGPS